MGEPLCDGQEEQRQVSEEKRESAEDIRLSEEKERESAEDVISTRPFDKLRATRCALLASP